MSTTRSAGHGWVVPNFSGHRARCGGPALCSRCRQEAEALGIDPQSIPRRLDSEEDREHVAA